MCRGQGMGKESETEIWKEIRTEIGGEPYFLCTPKLLCPQSYDDYDYSYYYCTVLCSTLHSHFVFSVQPPVSRPFVMLDVTARDEDDLVPITPSRCFAHPSFL